MLNESNRVELSSKGVPVDLLPATIQDAIAVTQGLGLSYLWVDSLCIVQDSSQDKDQELKKMHSVYENSYVTVCVADRESSEGFLEASTRNNRGYEAVCSVPYTLPNGRIGNLILEEMKNPYPPAHKINRRAWTLQERLLAPRALYYTNNPSLLYWDCQSLSDSPGGYKPRLSLGRLQREVAVPRTYGEDSKALDDTVANDIISQWQFIVKSYWTRLISHDEDRLNAIASLAAKFQAALPPSYIYAAGVWLDPPNDYKYFLDSLLWRSHYGGQRPTSVYVGPSWSWASVQGDTFFWVGHSAEPRCAVVDYGWELRSPELPYGRLQEGAWLKVRGYLQLVKLSFIQGCRGRISALKPSDEPSDSCMMDEDRYGTQEEIDVWYFLISDCGLLLEQVLDGLDNTFKRVGVATATLGLDDWLKGENLSTIVLV